jgi:hypothetical protein
MTFDHSNPSQFNDDPSRVAISPNVTTPQSLVYHTSQISSFEVKAYYAQQLGLAAYLSQNGSTWTPLPLAGTDPAPALGGQRYLQEEVPRTPIPAGTDWLKLRLTGTDTELGEVDIHAGSVAGASSAQAASRTQLPRGPRSAQR